jgi:serine/threonine protein kinase
MSTYTAEPGTRLAGRYRLIDQVSAGNGWTMWKALDETLARPVSVLTFAQGFPRVPEVVTAARAASRLTDPRMAQVFDVEDSGGQAYIVLEWVGGESLTDLLDNGPLDPALACSLITDAARALAGAHSLGQAHLRLTPDVLRWTRGSGIKITGLGIDAVLAGEGPAGAAAQDPAIADTIAIAGLLYAALTGYWPGEEPTRLPPAPLSDGEPAAPRQVSADVSSGLDSVITRSLLQRPGRHGAPVIQSPAEFAEALTAVAPPAPLPEPAPPAPAGYPGYGAYGPDPNNPDSWGMPERGPSGTAPHPSPESRYPTQAGGYQGNGYSGGGYPGAGYQEQRRRGGGRVLLSVAVLLVLAIIGLTVWAVGFRGTNNPVTSATGSPSASASAPATSTSILVPASASTYNPYGTTPGNTEHQSDVHDAIDSSTSSYWETAWYEDHASFGNLKPGVGLLIDMGRKVSLSQVEVLFSASGDTTAQIYLGNTDTISSSALKSDFTQVSKAATVSGDYKFPVSSTVSGRYVLIWLTSLPQVPQPSDAPSGHTYYEGKIYNVVVRGSAASSS